LKNSNLCDHNSPTLQTDRQTTCDRNTALCTKVHRAVITHMYTMTYRLLPTLPPISQHATCARLCW